METAVDRHLVRRMGRLSTPMSRGFLPSLLLHVSIVGFVVLGPMLAPKKPEPLKIRSVMLVPRAALGVPNPAVPAKRATPPKPAPPEPEKAAEKKPEPQPKREPPKTEALVVAEKKRPKPPEKRKAPSPPAEAAPPREASPPPRATSSGRGTASTPGQRQGSPQGHIAGTAAFGGAVGIDDPNFRYNYYVEQLLALIGAQWHRPNVDEGISAEVHFQLAKDGRASDLEIRKPSGSSTFDAAAMRAVLNASPLPPLPSAYAHDSLGVTLIFR